jgi:hypothetical protein
VEVEEYQRVIHSIVQILPILAIAPEESDRCLSMDLKELVGVGEVRKAA